MPDNLLYVLDHLELEVSHRPPTLQIMSGGVGDRDGALTKDLINTQQHLRGVSSATRASGALTAALGASQGPCASAPVARQATAVETNRHLFDPGRHSTTAADEYGDMRRSCSHRASFQGNKQFVKANRFPGDLE